MTRANILVQIHSTRNRKDRYKKINDYIDVIKSINSSLRLESIIIYKTYL